MLSGASTGQLIAMVATPIQSLLPPPYDNNWETARFRAAMWGKPLKELVMQMCWVRMPPEPIDWT